MKLSHKFALAAVSAAMLHGFATAKTADVVVLMDESGSMAGEQAWIKAAVPVLDTGLGAAGVTDNRYGLIGFGASAAPAPSRVRSFSVAGGQFGTAGEFVTAAGGLVTTGSREDGWAAIVAANAYTYRSGAVRNYILVTDEDRDDTFATNYEAMLGSLKATNTLLNAVVNANFKCGDGSAAIGVIGTTGYKADGAGGFSTCSGAAWGGTDSGTTFDNYIKLALDTGGGAWNLNILRSGGSNAESFTASFVDGKVGEIIIQPPPIPEPSTYALLLGGLVVVGWAAQRRRISPAT
jgi:hypothetical protein